MDGRVSDRMGLFVEVEKAPRGDLPHQVIGGIKCHSASEVPSTWVCT